MKRRIIIDTIGLILSLAWILGMWKLLGEDSSFRNVTFGRDNPFSIQAITWVAFFFGLAELLVHWLDAVDEDNQCHQRYLPEDEVTVLQNKDLGACFKRVSTTQRREDYFLPKLIKRIILQFHSSKSIEQSNTLLNTSLDFYASEIELRYSLLRYLVWLIPTLGFVGTVVGIMKSLKLIGEKGIDQIEYILTDVVNLLAIAFDTTLVALVLSAILMLFLNLIQSYEERVLNKSGEYCLDNLISRLYVPLQK